MQKIHGGGVSESFRTAFLVFSAFFASAACASTPYDDAVFKLDLRGGEAADTKPGDGGNAYDYSGDDASAMKFGDSLYPNLSYTVSAVPPVQQTINVVSPLTGDSASRSCLYFTQAYKPGDAKQAARTSVIFPGAAAKGDTVTVYVRFRWDGMVISGDDVYFFHNGFGGAWSSASGLSLSLRKVSNTTATLSFRVNRTHVGQNETGIAIKTGEWTDAFLTVANNGDRTSSVATLTVCRESDAAPVTKTLDVAAAMHYTDSMACNDICCGCYLARTSYDANPRSFKGAFADMMAWTRALDDAEKLVVMSGARGGEWQIGGANGNSAEFGDAAPADVYDAQTMPWSSLRKSLTAANPFLRIKTTMAADEAQSSRTLSFLSPAFDGAGDTVPVEVSVNGASAGTIDLKKTASITVPKRFWWHDADGGNVIEIARTGDVSGTVLFDAVSLAPVAETHSAMEDAAFWMDLRGGESTATQPGVVGSVFDFSSATSALGYMGGQGAGKQTLDETFGQWPAQVAESVVDPVSSVASERTVLRFYQTTNDEGTKSANTGVVFPGLARTGRTQTFYFRFRWDGAVPGASSTTLPAYFLHNGNAVQGWSAYGVSVMLDKQTVFGDTTTIKVFVRVADSTADTGLTISAGEWNDLFVTFAQNDGNTASTVTATLQKPGAIWKTATKTVAKPTVFNGSNLTLGVYFDSRTYNGNTRSFRGAFADFAAWDRELTDGEKASVMARAQGAKWFVGAVNGRGDEFADDGAADVFEPESMPWRMMRKTLTAENPALTLKSPLTAAEEKMAKLLSIRPILRGGAESSCPVAVSVNGERVGAFDLAVPAKRNILVPRKFWTRDANGDATVAIVRTGAAAGTLEIDALSLSGSWQIGRDDGRSQDMKDQKDIHAYGFAGDSTEGHFCGSVSVGGGRPSVEIGLWVPEGTADLYDYRFSTKGVSGYSATGEAAMELFANGVSVGDAWTFSGASGAVKGLSNVFTIPAGTLSDGWNRLSFKMTTPASETGWAIFDWYCLQLVQPSQCLTITIR